MLTLTYAAFLLIIATAFLFGLFSPLILMIYWVMRADVK